MFKQKVQFQPGTGSRGTVPTTTAQFVQEQRAVGQERIQTLPEVALLKTIPGIEPFLIPDLIPDLIYIVQSEGVQTVLDQVFPGNKEVHRQLMDIFQRNNLHSTILKISETYRHLAKAQGVDAQITDDQLLQHINGTGVQKLAQLVAKADPKNPASIIFSHPSQIGFIDVQKTEIELIKSDPDVEERTDIQCACGKSRVKYVPVQLRRADEGSSYLVTCVECKRSWVMH